MISSRCGTCHANFIGTKCPQCKTTSPVKGAVRDRVPAKPSISSPEPVGTHLASLIPDWAKSMKGGCGCKDWELKMNRWGVDACEKNREQIVNHLMSQDEHLVKPLQCLPEALKRAVANKMLDRAIKMSRQD